MNNKGTKTIGSYKDSKRHGTTIEYKNDDGKRVTTTRVYEEGKLISTD